MTVSPIWPRQEPIVSNAISVESPTRTLSVELRTLVCHGKAP